MSKQRRPARDWTTAELALMRQHYPETGTKKLLGLLDRARKTITSKAIQLGLEYTGRAGRPVRPAPTAPTTEHDPRPKSRNTLKPLQTSKVRALPVKHVPKTEVATPLGEIILAMKNPKCPPGRRLAFTVAAHQGMPAAIKAWDEWPSQQQAA